MARYRGTVEILTDDGQRVVSAYATYEVHVNPRSGMKGWNGVLTQIEPQHTLNAGGPYRLCLPNGEEGTILISNLRYRSSAPETATFVGSGPEPGSVDERQKGVKA